jgi:hypothetical protein
MGNLSFLFFSLILLGEVFFLIRKARFSPWLAPLAAIIGDTLVLYVFALFGGLEIGYYVVLGGSIILGILSIVPFKRIPPRPWFSIPVISFILLLLFSWFYSRGTLFYQWDEFSHWGVMFRFLMTTDKLPLIDPSLPRTVFYNYPPFTSLFQYFTARFIGFEESSAYFAQMTLLFSAVIALIPVTSWRDWRKYLLFFGVVIVSVIALDFVFLKITVDFLLGLLFTVGLLLVSLDGKKEFDRYVLILLICCALILTKSTGVFFAVFLVLAEMLVIFTRASFQKPFKAAIASGVKALLSWKMFFLILIPILVAFSWQVHSLGFSDKPTHLSLTGAGSDSSEAFPISIEEYKQKLIDRERQQRVETKLYFSPQERTMSVTEVLRSFSTLAPYRTKLIVSGFIEKLSESSYTASGLSIVMVILLIIGAISLASYLIEPDTSGKRSAFHWLNSFLFLGFIFYSLYILFAIIFTFPPYRAIILHSEYRYLGSYLLGWWLFNAGIIYQSTLDLSETRKVSSARIFLAGVIVAGVILIPLSSFISLAPSPNFYRLRADRIYNKINQVDFSGNDKIYDIFQYDHTDGGVSHFMIKYLLTPIPMNIHGWEMGTIPSETDYLTVSLTPQEWINLLNDQGYTYVLVSLANDNFWNNYSVLFDRFDKDEEGQLFRVKPDHLEKVDIEDG